MNAFALQQIHYVTEHGHDHRVHLHDGHENCGEDLQFHAYHFDADCSICDFNFSPKEPVENNILTSFASLVYHFVFSGTNLLLFENAGKPASLRGPPVYFI